MKKVLLVTLVFASVVFNIANASENIHEVDPTRQFQSVQQQENLIVAANSSYYGEISEKTGRPKTVYVKPYCKKDGTCVEGYYRSPPKRK